MKKKQNSIHYRELTGKYIEYRDPNGAFRISKVIKRDGREMKVKLTNHKKLTTIKKEDVICNIYRGHCRRQINWNIKSKK